MLASEHPHLILLDVVMPGRNGFQACRELKNSQEFGSHSDCAGEFEERRERQVLGHCSRAPTAT
jgi:CheY-like chemotaxis protein